jgi:outer membrane protein OmpA-like peptidoglycan-associated protein
VSAAKKIQAEADREHRDLLEVTAKRSKDKLGKTESSLEKTRAELERQERELKDKQKLLTDEQRKLKERELELTKERAARAEAEKRQADAMKSLEEIAKIKEDARGTIITLSGAVLFKTNQSALLPIAERQLRKVAEALNAYDEGRKILIAGHTDSRGSRATNMRLSLARAESVRTFLVNNGVSPDRIRALGRGPDEPIAENRTAEGRANNRRVEIIVEGK